MIQLTAAGKRFGPKVLFQELDWLITPHDRVGLVGANGTGKTTLLKILAGTESLDYGTVTQQRGIQSGYLPQDGLSLSGRSVFAECLSVFEQVHQMQREQEDLARRMAEVDHASAEYQQIAERFHRIQAEMQARDGYTIEAEVGTVLNGLGFRTDDWKRRTEEFSGGWQMRIALAKLLLQKPNLLLLDEPTNHLDLETRNWLEQYLVNYPHAYVLISHDRYFLDVTVKKTAEIWNKQVFFYSGNYEKYLAQKAERRAQLEAAYTNQIEKIDQLEAFINRFRAQATNAKQAHMLDDMFEAAPRSTQTELRSLLGCFLFSEDDVFKTIGVLSGGERNRYALARMLLHPSNFLLLDEPTNHLDLRAKDVLLNSLQKFTGTVVFDSHDRYFIDKLATRVFEIGEERVEVFPGNYEDYLWRKEGKSGVPPEGSLEASVAPSLATHTAATNHGAAEIGSEPRQKRLNPIKLKQMKERLQEVEEEITRLEAAIAAAETALQNFVSAEETRAQTELLDRCRTELRQRMSEWEEMSIALES